MRHSVTLTLKMVPWLSLATLHFSRITQSSRGVPIVVVVVRSVVVAVVGSVKLNSFVVVFFGFLVKLNNFVVDSVVVVVVLAVVVKSLKREAVVRFWSSTSLEI